MRIWWGFVGIFSWFLLGCKFCNFCGTLEFTHLDCFFFEGIEFRLFCMYGYKMAVGIKEI